jgi:hypothetical protein
MVLRHTSAKATDRGNALVVSSLTFTTPVSDGVVSMTHRTVADSYSGEDIAALRSSYEKHGEVSSFLCLSYSDCAHEPHGKHSLNAPLTGNGWESGKIRPVPCPIERHQWVHSRSPATAPALRTGQSEGFANHTARGSRLAEWEDMPRCVPKDSVA